MRIFTIHGASIHEIASLDQVATIRLTDGGYCWITCARDEFGTHQKEIQAALHALCGIQLFDLHVSDLLNPYLPSHYDYTNQYDIMVFRRLSAHGERKDAAPNTMPRRSLFRRRGGPPILKKIDTTPIGFVILDNVLISVHPPECAIQHEALSRLTNDSASEARTTPGRPPSSPADLMLRMTSLIVDGYLELRRELSHQLDRWQSDLLDPSSRFDNWGSMLDARLTLHYLDEICDDQRTAIQDWIEAVNMWPEATSPQSLRERDLMQVRSRDVLEHIERVSHHVRRLEHSTETAVQMHFNAQGHRTNNIMRTLTTLTAIFLPLNLIAAIFGMNFDSLPLVHRHEGFWWATGAMLVIAFVLSIFFWRKSYLSRSNR